MSKKPDISLDEFLSHVKMRNTAPDRSERDPRLLDRMDNDICRQCHQDYRKKYPNTPFQIRCQGIYGEDDFQFYQEKAKANGEALELEDIRMLLDRAAWFEKNIVYKDDNGDIKPFKPRDYQLPILRCTARHKVDRCGRGMGKTSLGVGEELHRATTKKRDDILVVGPVAAQSKKWQIEIDFQLNNSPSLRGVLKGRLQQPYILYTFMNGSQISIFTAGSKSGKGADSVRSQSPHKTRLEEQDLLCEADYSAILPLAHRYRNSELHGSSTPSGDQSQYWRMCTQDPEYKEFFAPITLHPDWSPEMELRCRREARTNERFMHEYMAEFSDSASGVFKGCFVDAARATYSYSGLKPLPNCYYHLGVDWNGGGTGTKIRVVEYNPDTQRRRMVAHESIDSPDSRTTDSLNAIKRMNHFWGCEGVWLDYGFANGQDELLRKMGQRSTDAQDRKLTELRVIDFGANLKFNRLVPKRNEHGVVRRDEQELERRTKPFMVEGFVMSLENGLFEFSTDDNVLDDQFRAYRVDKYSQHGYANTYKFVGDAGDHDLDATMLAMLGIEITHGLFMRDDIVTFLATVSYVGGFGVGRPDSGQTEEAPSLHDMRRQAAGIPSRTGAPNGDGKPDYQIVLPMRNGAYVAPNRSSGASGPMVSRTSPFGPGGNSRTSIFRGASRGYRQPGF